ncbi:MAG: hypothetical protein M9951_17235 [Burkholderiaceae bacterium]|nr:hypothetical protein [Burkholderiaceae bacterium]
MSLDSSKTLADMGDVLAPTRCRHSQGFDSRLRGGRDIDQCLGAQGQQGIGGNFGVDADGGCVPQRFRAGSGQRRQGFVGLPGAFLGEAGFARELRSRVIALPACRDRGILASAGVILGLREPVGVLVGRIALQSVRPFARCRPDPLRAVVGFGRRGPGRTRTIEFRLAPDGAPHWPCQSRSVPGAAHAPGAVTACPRRSGSAALELRHGLLQLPSFLELPAILFQLASASATSPSNSFGSGGRDSLNAGETGFVKLDSCGWRNCTSVSINAS